MRLSGKSKILDRRLGNACWNPFSCSQRPFGTFTLESAMCVGDRDGCNSPFQEARLERQTSSLRKQQENSVMQETSPLISVLLKERKIVVRLPEPIEDFDPPPKPDNSREQKRLQHWRIFV